MKAIVVYSSQSGNTEKLARTVCDALPENTSMVAVDNAPDPSGYDLVALGFWLQAGKPDPKSAVYLERLKGHPKVFLFATHGADPDSEHAKNAMTQARSIAEGAAIIGSFNCYGEVNPKVLEKAQSKPQPPVWIEAAVHATGHPNAEDKEHLRSLVASAIE